MKKFSKILAVVCAAALLVCSLVIPTSAFTGSTVTMPSKITVLEDFEGGLTKNSWQGAGGGSVALSSDYGYGTAGSSLQLTVGGSWPGAKTTTGRNWLITDTGIALWIYVPEALTANKTMYVKLNVKTPTVTNTTVYEGKINTNTLSVGENLVLIPYEDFALSKTQYATLTDQGVYIDQFEIIFTSNTEGTIFVDQIAIYRDDNAPVEFIPSTVAMPENYEVIDNFDIAGSLGWQADNSTIEYSGERGYGTSGRSIHVVRNETTGAWTGTKTRASLTAELKGEGITFWAYNMGGDLTDFAVILYQGSTQYEKKITLKAGEGVYTIPYSDFQKNGVAVDVTQTVKQFKFTKSAKTLNYYIDELGYYGVEAGCQHTNKKDANVVGATYFTAGKKDIVCDDCGETVEEDVEIPCDTAAPVIYTKEYDAAANTLTVSWTYSKAFEEDIIKAGKIEFNYAIGTYSNTVDVSTAQVGGSVTFEGFNAERLAADLSYNLVVAIEGIDTAKLATDSKETVKASAVANNDKLNALLNAINAAGEADIVKGQVNNTATLVSNTMEADLKAGTLDLRFVASQDLITKLNTLGKEGRTVTLTVTIGNTVTKDITIDTLKKVTMVKITGMSFEQLNSIVTVKLGFDYEGTEKDFTTDVVEFNCGEIIADTDTAVANAFEAFMK